MAYETYDEIESRSTPAVHWLIGLCVGVYFLQATLIGDQNMQAALGYMPGDLASRSLYTIVTYMFVHGGLVHLALNLWTLWLFGPRVERAWGSSTFTWFYLWCGLGGWAAHYMFEDRVGLVGASAAALGIAVAYAFRWPDDEVLFFGVVPMKVKWMVALFAVMNIVDAVLSSGSNTAYVAHLGGMFAAFVYLRAPGSGSIGRFRGRIAPAPDYGDDTPRPVPKSSSRPRERDVDEIVAQSKAAVARVRPAAPAPTPAAPQQQPSPSTALDAVLDKIAADKGMQNLTVAERLLLDEWSKRLRGA